MAWQAKRASRKRRQFSEGRLRRVLEDRFSISWEAFLRAYEQLERKPKGMGADQEKAVEEFLDHRDLRELEKALGVSRQTASVLVARYLAVHKEA